ncbi:hypothetical protein CVD28_04905 [Bacillus sp. M6-12]|uniref:IDEAL domain-containing protein n=1 Tax=Bacillus sp. M6-12 TaxID=2054166 RepID=UPI000C7839E3|nr:IDEAL domain-containing protein [Bacillus sp. M6-12]PLS18799.1 hypothetical protein CVD28_04905 [Bacillus sp. M6-12]
MKHEKSYSELTKSCAMNKKKRENYMQNLMIDMIITEALLKRKQQKLVTEIDHALDQKNKAQFMKLTCELNQVNQAFGN